MASKKREYNLISGIEEKEEKHKRIRKYLFQHFKKHPEKFFYEWDKSHIIIRNNLKWAFPKPILKISVILTFNISKKKTSSESLSISKKSIKNKTVDKPSIEEEKDIIYDIDETSIDMSNNMVVYNNTVKNIRILLDVVHSPTDQLKNYITKKNKNNNKKETKYYLLMSIHNHDIEKDISESDISEVFKSFNREKNKITYDQRLFNMLFFIIDSISNNDQKFTVYVRKNAFFNDNVKKNLLPISFDYLSKFYK